MNKASIFGKSALSLFLILVSLLSLLSVSASASTIEDGSKTAYMTLGPGHFYLKTTAGTSLGAWGYTYTTNDGLTGPAYCVNHGLHFTSRTLPIDGKYTSSPKTAGVFANGYPQHSLDTFLGLYLSQNAILSGLTEEEYAYATQLAIWATLGQLGIDGTPFTAGREQIVRPTGDTQQARVFRAVQLLLNVANSWTFVPQTGMYIRTDEDTLGGNISIPADMTLEYAADNESYGFKREVIGGKSYYTHEYIFASATSTYYDNYCIEVWADGAPAGTIFTDLDNNELAHGTFRETATWTLPTENKATSLNDNGFEYSGAAKLCIPVDTAPNSGEITVNCGSYVMQYNIYLAHNGSSSEQSYIIADPSKGTLTADAALKWGGIVTETGDVEVMKVDGNGTPLAGAEFTLAGSDGSSRTGTSGADGKVIWDLLNPLYTYTLTEMKPPAGYGVADPITLNIKAARTNYVTVKDSVSKQLTVKKIDRQTGYSLMGAVIAFEQIDGSFYTTKTTDHAGMIQLDADQLPIGSYKVYEVTAPEGYDLDSTAQTVNWDGLRDVTLTFNNVRKPTLIIYKCDAGNNYSLPYATFEVYRNGQLVTTVTTNQNGLAYVPDVTTGYYTVKETIAPAGYVLDSTEHSVYVDNYDPATTDDPRIAIENKVMPMLRIVKYDAQTKKPLPDTTFAVYRETALIGEYTTNANGEVFLYDLAPDTYFVKEISAPDTHVVNSTPQEIELEAGEQNYTLVFLNYLKPGIHLTKLDSQSMTPLVNARFRITEIGGTFSKEYVSDANGEIDLTGLTPASYTVEELTAPDGYLIDDAQRIIKINEGENASFVFTDTKKPVLTVLKYDALREKLLPGATLRIAKIEDGFHYLDRITDTQGSITIENLDPGVYSVQEISAPTGYIVNSTEYHVQIFPGRTSQLIVCDDKKPDLRIIKKDADTGALLAGATFKINRADGSTLTTEQTDANGEIFLKELDPGVYQITEVSPPVGYLPAQQPTQLITLDPNKLGTVIFENNIKPALTVNKIDSVTGDPLKAAKFHITYASNQTFSGDINDLGDFYTDENGQIVISELRDGWYKVAELEPPAGYAIKGPATQEFYILAGKGKTVTFENTPLSALVVYKYDSVTGEAVKNAVFQVKYLSGTSGTGGTVIGTYLTSANGSFTVTGLEAGTYIVEELASDSGHVIDAAPQTAYISGEPQSVVQLYFGNAPKGSLLIKKINSANHAPLSDVQFFITDSTGAVVGNSNGYFTTDSAGTILINGIAPGTTLIAKETIAKDGYVLDDTPQAAYIKAGQTITLEFRNAPKGGLIIQKRDSFTGAPLSGAVFRVVTSDGAYADNYGGYVSSNGLYTTAENGQIQLYDLTPGTYVVTEDQAPAGYVLNSQPQTVVVNAADTQTLVFYDTPIGGLIITKSDGETGARISGVQFEVQKMNGEIVGQYTTDRNGTIRLPGLDSGWYTVTELKAASGYQLDPTPQQVEIKDGATATLELTNRKTSRILLHKVDENGHGIYGAVFVLYDTNRNPIGEYTSDQDGYVYLDEGLADGRYYIREIKAADGYVLDDEVKTVYVQYGATSELTWVNAAVRGQIQIIKKSADDNPINGLPKGTLLEGAIFEVYDKAGNVVDTIKTDRNGHAASKLLPLSRYNVREVTAPDYYSVNPTVITAYLEYEGQIVIFEVEDSSVATGANIKKTGYAEVMPGQPIRYTITGVANTSTVQLGSFYWRDTLPGQITLGKFVTGTYNQQLTYKVVYKTNLSGDSYRTLADNLSTAKNYVLDARPAVLGLATNERVTEVMFIFGNVKAGFTEVETAYIYGTVNSGLSNGARIVNVADVGGLYNGQWVQAVTRWLTTVYVKSTVTLPKTGY